MRMYVLGFIAFVLTISAGILGILLIKEFNPSFSISALNPFASRNAPVNVNASKNWVKYDDVHPTRSPEQLQVLNAPPSDASQSDHSNYIAFIGTLAKKEAALDVTSCHPKPVAFTVKNGTSFTVKNDSTSSRSIAIRKSRRVTIPAKGTATVQADFPSVPGVYGYTCDKLVEPVGVLYVTQ